MEDTIVVVIVLGVVVIGCKVCCVPDVAFISVTVVGIQSIYLDDIVFLSQR